MTVPEKYIPNPVPSLPESQALYLQRELRKLALVIDNHKRVLEDIQADIVELQSGP